MRYSVFLLLIFSLASVTAQDVAFQDPLLKAFLINEWCADLDGDGSFTDTVDADEDGELSQEEVSAIEGLWMFGYQSLYPFTSMDDLNLFTNLQELTLVHCDSLMVFSDLDNDELQYLLIDACYALDHIDVSSLTGLETLRIEDFFDGFDYLNVQNGSAAIYYSLFYTLNIGSACVDSIASEYEITSSAMEIGILPSLVCSPSEIIGHELELEMSLEQRDNMLVVSCESNAFNMRIIDLSGKVLISKPPGIDQVNISALPVGPYLVQILSKEGRAARQWIKQ